MTPGPTTPSIALVAGGRSSDTISALVAAPLVVEVKDAAGRPAAGAVVRFTTDTARAPRAYLVTGPGPFDASLSRDVVLDSAGRASALVRLGDVAGKAVLTIAAPSFGVATVDTIEVRTGARVRLKTTLDTSAFIGGTTQLSAAVVDRGSNAYPDPVTYLSSSASVDVSTTGLITGRTFGEATVSVTSGRFAATVRVAVVPRGTIAVREFGGSGVANQAMTGVAVADLDLSHYRYLTPSLAKPFCNGCGLPIVAPRWHPNGLHILYSAGYESGYNADSARLSTVDFSGGVRPLLASPTLRLATEPVMAKDGVWVYFAGWPPEAFRYALWRVRADGSGAEPLVAAKPAEFGEERRPDPSPDGSLVAYAAGDPVRPRVRVRSVASGARTSLDVVGTSPRWSPSGDLIAFVVAPNFEGYSGELHVIRPDGTGERRVTSGTFGGIFDWSPDGKYIVAERGDAGGISIIDVATGAAVRLTTSARFGQPAWKPMAPGVR